MNVNTANFPRETMTGVIALNHTHYSNAEIQELYDFMPNCVKVDLFDKNTWRPHDSLREELENYNAKDLWLNWWHICSSQPFQLVVKTEQLEPYFHFRYRLYKAGSQFENIHFVLITSKEDQYKLKRTHDHDKELNAQTFNQTVYIENYDSKINIYNEVQ